MSQRLLDITRWSSAGIIVTAALIRLMSVHPRTPWWDLDPSRQPIPETALLPSTALMLDALVWLASGLGVFACVRAGQRFAWMTGALVLIGAGFVAAHAFLGELVASSLGGPDNLATGSAWASALAGGWALFHLGSDLRIKRAVALALLGAGWMLAARGAHQVFVEHPRTVAEYQANADSMLIGQGIEPGTAGAREFERRLVQPEATGWVGLSNANASIAAACAVGMLGLLLAAWHAGRPGAHAAPPPPSISSGEIGVVTIATIVAVGGLAITYSKGGTVAGAMGIVLLVTLWWVSRRPGRINRHAGLLALLLPLSALGAIALRGVLGERLSELSLLFRWHYLVGASGVICDSLPVGVGPGGFKAAYALHKPALNPELVESPHSIFFDWTATLGFGGACWSAVLLTLTCIALRAALSHADTTVPRETEPSRRAVPVLGSLIVVFACTACWSREFLTVSPDEWPLRLVALIGWIATIFIGARVLALPTADRTLALTVSAAALAIVSHAQIEVTPVLPATCAWFMALVGVAASQRHTPSTKSLAPPRPSVRPAITAAIPVIAASLAAALTSLSIAPVRHWERLLRHAADLAAPLAQLRTLSARAATDGNATQELAATLATRTGRPIPMEQRAIQSALADTFAESLRPASTLLMDAAALRPGLVKPADFAVRLRVEVAAQFKAVGREADSAAAVRDAVEAIERVQKGYPAGITYFGRRRFFLGPTAGAYGALFGIDGNPLWLERSAQCWADLSDREPGSLTPVVRLAETLSALGRSEEARDAARRAVAISETLRLDPIKQLQGDSQRRIEAILGK